MWNFNQIYAHEHDENRCGNSLGGSTVAVQSCPGHLLDAAEKSFRQILAYADVSVENYHSVVHYYHVINQMNVINFKQFY